MKHSRALPTAADALRHVFFQPPTPRPLPRLRPLPTLPQRRHQSEEPEHSPFRAFRPSGFRRSSPTFDEDTHPRPTRTDAFGPLSTTPSRLRNEEIGPIIHLVLPDGSLTPPTPLATILATVNTRTHFLQQVTPPGSLEFPVPVCKIFDKVEVKAKERARAKQLRAAATGTKQLEVAWGIARNDLEHKMAKMAEMCAEGKRVEVVLGGARRKGWQKKKVGGEEEQEAVMKLVRERIRGMEGGKEWRGMEGEVGKVVTLFVEGKGKRGKKGKDVRSEDSVDGDSR